MKLDEHQERELILRTRAAVIQERTRCARLLENTIAQLGGAKGPPLEKREERAIWVILSDRLDAIRRPWAVRQADRHRAIPQRERHCCGNCGGDDHTRRSKKCPMYGQEGHS